MKKFHSLLSRSGDKILKDRAEQVAQLVEMEQDSLLKQLEKKMITLNFQKKELLDMSPDNRYSLRLTGKDFDAAGWVNNYQSLCVQIANCEIELEVAKATSEDLFSEVKEK